MKGIYMVKFEIHRFDANSFYFQLIIPEGQIIMSNPYKTKQGTKKGIKYIKRDIFCAKIIDLTKDN